MRILRVQFENLNSLVGKWVIDLTHPAYTSDGIFAITGPTGAGKSTILDAICLALYGRTPRLNKVTKSGNEIMSRRTGECHAEVTFETQEGRFCCQWSQRRARGKPDGDLQAPKHEISNANTGKIIDAQLRTVANRIVRVTGMDFDRFTRSMLLAQGGFAAFLQAAPDERAPILEQITGTEIYSRISIHVHERLRDERRQLDMLQAELAGTRPLTEEEEQQLALRLDQSLQRERELTQQVERNNSAIAWIEGMARLEDELKRLEQDNADLQTKVEAFAPQQERLRLANQALEFAADHATLTAVRKEQAEDQRALDASQASLPACAQAAKQAEDAEKTAVEKLAKGKTDQQAQLPKIRKARELDLKIEDKDAPIKTARASVAELSTSLEALQAKQKCDDQALDTLRKALEEVEAQLAASQADAALVEHLAGLRGRFDALKTLSVQLDGKLLEAKQANAECKKATSSLQKQTTGLEDERRGLEASRQALADKQAELLTVLENREAAAWRKEALELATQKDLIGKTLEAVESLAMSRQADSDLDARRTSLAQQASTQQCALEIHNEKQAGLEKEVGLLIDQLTLLKKIKDLKAERAKLEDGEPCPLCGATEHPYAEGNIPAPDATQQRLTKARAELKSVHGEIVALNDTITHATKDLKQADAEREKLTASMEKAGQVIRDNCAELTAEPRLKASDPELFAKLEQLRDDNALRRDHAANILDAAEAIEKALTTLRDAQEKTKDSLAQRERDAQNAAHRKDSAEQLLARLHKEAEACREQQEQSLGALRQELQPFAVTEFAVDTLDAVFEQLKARRDQWQERSKRNADLAQEITALESRIRHQAERIATMEGEVTKQQRQLEGLVRERATLHGERQNLFGDKNVDEEEARLAQAIDSATNALEAARQSLSVAQQALSQLKARIDELEKAIHARNVDLQSKEEAFLARLAASGFTDEASYTSASLPEAERKQLARQSQELTEQRTEIASNTRDRTSRLDAERAKKITEEPLAVLMNAKEEMAGAHRELQQEIGGIRKSIEDNESLKQQQQERLQAIEAQKRECGRWDRLHFLIGSSDGKKYRNFAQGLTFEMMISHANTQLQRLTDRYLLVRNDTQPLELDVIDNYQAGEIRTTKNLSGGESFIVSLSLALGLSHMAGKNVRVDSLFLDEGFGTLDEEALDTALETLAGLQQDGKLIGVISHVPALKERIATQIEVTPQNGGRSRISGPGCSNGVVPPR